MKKLLVLTAVLISPVLLVVAMQLPLVGVLLFSIIGDNVDPFIAVALGVLMVLAALGFGGIFIPPFGEVSGVIFILGALF